MAIQVRPIRASATSIALLLVLVVVSTERCILKSPELVFDFRATVIPISVWVGFVYGRLGFWIVTGVLAPLTIVEVGLYSGEVGGCGSHSGLATSIVGILSAYASSKARLNIQPSMALRRVGTLPFIVLFGLAFKGKILPYFGSFDAGPLTFIFEPIAWHGSIFLIFAAFCAGLVGLPRRISILAILALLLSPVWVAAAFVEGSTSLYFDDWMSLATIAAMFWLQNFDLKTPIVAVALGLGLMIGRLYREPWLTTSLTKAKLYGLVTALCCLFLVLVIDVRVKFAPVNYAFELIAPWNDELYYGFYANCLPILAISALLPKKSMFISGVLLLLSAVIFLVLPGGLIIYFDLWEGVTVALAPGREAYFSLVITTITYAYFGMKLFTNRRSAPDDRRT